MIFSLDVGTRTLIGMLADFDENEKLLIKHTVVREHENRAMVDGQIHDVEKVSRGVSKLLDEMQEKSGNEIKDVAVALAGRFLVTSSGEYETDVSTFGHLENDIVKKMELEAVKNATDAINNLKGMYCVGYSVLYYKLDEEWIKNLVGQKGNKAYVKVISAFLPKNVVEAMIAVLEKNKLNPVHITLEPIAAMSLVVPEDLRNLNIVMVDVGAGTSDIAVSDDGTIIGYGMVPMAGDEITDAISKELLIDFITAENIKRNLCCEKKFTYRDILDFEQEINSEDVFNIINPVIDSITDQTAKKILELNGKSPVAVMLVGGGGKVPGFKEKLAEKLGIAGNRIALKDLKSLRNVIFEGEILEGSEYITPAGIADVALRKKGNVFNSITVNGKKVNMMMIGTDMTVMQVLLQSGHNLSDLIGKASAAVTFELNGDLMIKKGNIGKEAPVKINGIRGTLKSKVKPGDEIEIGEPENGDETEVTVKDIIKNTECYINQEKFVFNNSFRINGKPADDDYKIKDGDRIETEKLLLKDIFNGDTENIYFSINGNPVEIPGKNIYKKQGLILEEDYVIQNGDILEKEFNSPPPVSDFIESENNYIEVLFNDQTVKLPCDKTIIKANGKIIDSSEPVREGINYTFEKINELPKVLDLFSHLSIDTSKIKSFELTVNGEKSFSFMQSLDNNSIVRFIFK